MSNILVADLAKVVGAPVHVLLKQLQEAGISATGVEDRITEQQKLKLLNHIRAGQKKTPHVKNKITLRQRTTSKLKVSSLRGRKKTVSIEIRRRKKFGKKHTNKIKVSVVSRSAQLAKQLARERKAREEATKKTNQQRKQAKIRRNKTIKAKPIAKQSTVKKTFQKKRIISQKTPVTKPRFNTVEKTVKIAGPDSQTVVPLTLKQQREVVVKKARAAASAALKRRPSRIFVKKKPIESPKVVVKKAAEKTTTNTQIKKKPKTSKAKTNLGSGKLHLANSGRHRNKKKRRKGRGRGRNRRQVAQAGTHKFEKPTAPIVREVEIPATIVVSDLAQKLATKATDVIMVMMKMGVIATINQSIDQDTATLVVEEMGHVAKPMQEMDDDSILSAILGVSATQEYEEKTRPPVVTIMGHVDHGKTSLLDYIRRTRVAASEAGGITQHIGAYHVNTPNGMVSFLDTPGHAAFTAMRARGAKATDVVVLVVAADDGVMPQTKEAIKHARAADVSLVVAINKIDKEGANPSQVRNELSQYEVIAEEWGGEDVFVEVSAKTGQGIDELLESILLVAEVLELTAPIEGPASGVVIEASIEKGRGAVSTVLVQKGKLKKGDILLAGTEYGRIRAMFNENGKPIKEALPSIPVRVLGLSGTPKAGADAVVIAEERKARDIAEMRRQKQRDSKFAMQRSAKLSSLFDNIQSGEKNAVNLLLKADVQGSVEALSDALNELSTDEIKVKIISEGVGGINGGDVNLAIASDAIVIGFNVRADATARRAIAEAGVDLRYYSVIYDIIDDVRQAMIGLLSPEMREEFIGLAEVKDVFRSSGFGAVAGCLIIEGVVRKGNSIRVLRDNVVIYEGELESLRRHKDDVENVRMGTECGIAVKNYNDVQTGDQIECFEITEIQRTL